MKVNESMKARSQKTVIIVRSSSMHWLLVICNKRTRTVQNIHLNNHAFKTVQFAVLDGCVGYLNMNLNSVLLKFFLLVFINFQIKNRLYYGKMLFRSNIESKNRKIIFHKLQKLTNIAFTCVSIYFKYFLTVFFLIILIFLQINQLKWMKWYDMNLVLIK